MTAAVEAPIVRWSEEFWDEFTWIREGGRTISECARALGVATATLEKRIVHAPRAARKAYSPELVAAQDLLDAHIRSGEPFAAEEIAFTTNLDPKVVTNALSIASKSGRVVRTGRFVRVVTNPWKRLEWVAA